MIFLNKDSKEALYMQIYRQAKNDIVTGVMKEGAILAGSRGLARTLKVSRNTVDNAYSQLLAEGYITPQKGIGYVVTKLPKIKIAKSRQTFGSVNDIPQSPIETQDDIVYDLTNSSHTSDLFPKALWRRYTLECMERLNQEAKISSYQDKQGELYLRRNLLLYLERIRGVHCNESQIVITCGIQQSLDYICNLLFGERATVLMEEPGFNKAAAVFQNNGMTIQPVSIDKDGIIVAELPATRRACAIYSTPSHQFPTGVTMPISRRYQLLDWAKKKWNLYHRR